MFPTQTGTARAPVVPAPAGSATPTAQRPAEGSAAPWGHARRVAGGVQDRVIQPMLDAGDLLPEDVERAHTAVVADREHRSAVFHLLDLGKAERARVLAMLERVFHTATVDLTTTHLDRRTLDLLDGPTARRLRAVPLRQEKRDLYVALGDPNDINTISEIRDVTGMRPVPVLADDHALREAIERSYADAASDHLHRVASEAAKTRTGGIRGVAELSVEMDRAVSQAEVPQLVTAFLDDAVKKRASDIHFEFFRNTGRIRYRIDGQLAVVKEIDPSWGREIVNRIKVISELNSSQDRVPQDGKTAVENDGQRVDFRVSTLPTVAGVEHVVLRVLAKAEQPIDVKRVGMPEVELGYFLEALSMPQGMVLVTGPTGSGKSTTLYAALDHLNEPHRCIITLEDPVEREITGIRQCPVAPHEDPKLDFSFATGLKAILRQDPNVIMVGEIRDLETAGTAVKAAQTGHLVLATLHTNDAPSTVRRMMDIGVENYNLVDALSLIIAQRLVRRICPRCGEPHKPTPEALSRARMTRDEADSIPFYKGRGCAYCSGTGYFGRTGIFEVLHATEALKTAIYEQRTVPELRQIAIDGGMRTLRQSGIEMMRRGETTLDEVTRETVF